MTECPAAVCYPSDAGPYPSHVTASTNWALAGTRSDVYARPDIYDMEYEGAGNHDARLLARVRRRRVLELACGSGRVTVTLAAALPMADIVGVDSSIDMLGKAATARDAAEPLVRERVTREGRHARLARHGRHLRRRRHCLVLGVALAYAR